jgi:hypothetical protein
MIVVEGFENHRKDISTRSLIKLWAQKYIRQLDETNEDWKVRQTSDLEDLQQILRLVSVKAWDKTEGLLTKEVKRHRINPTLINPWDIAQDVYKIYDKAFRAYTGRLSPQHFSRLISTEIGSIRQRYTADDPRVLGFVSLQFHYTGQLLLAELSSTQQAFINRYFKVIDDHLYMPLQRAYYAAARYSYDDPALQAVRSLLGVSSEIAEKIVKQTIKAYPNYRSYSGSLEHPYIQISSIRDVEMFQVYLWVCVLEQSVLSIQQELFPLCVMLYPVLNVRWELVRQLIFSLYKEFQYYLEPQYISYLTPFYEVLWELFSPEVLS